MARNGREVVEALIATINARNIDGMDDVFHEDAVMVWPQSGERIVGGDNRRGIYRAFPQLPTITPRRLTGEGDLWVAEADLDYGDGDPYQAVFVFELRDGKIAQETAYWTKPFPAPDWRARWVELPRASRSAPESPVSAVPSSSARLARVVSASARVRGTAPGA